MAAGEEVPPLSPALQGQRRGHVPTQTSKPGQLRPGMTVSAVARRLGVAPATLRTWDRRYGLGPSHHAAGSHRRYSEVDVARLDHMHRLVLAGISPGEAARAALDIPLGDFDTVSGIEVSAIDASVEVGRAGGGNVVAIPGGTPSARGLARAALALEQEACEQIIDQTIQHHGIVWSWDHLLVPVLVAVGERWEQTGVGIEVEHVLSEAVESAFRRRSKVPGTPLNARPVLLAGTALETHTLPLWAVAAGLAERGVSARMLGGRTPVSALVEAIKKTGPAAILLWSQYSKTAIPDMMLQLPGVRPTPRVFLAGPGWSNHAARGERVGSLNGALDALVHAVGG